MDQDLKDSRTSTATVSVAFVLFPGERDLLIVVVGFCGDSSALVGSAGLVVGGGTAVLSVGVIKTDSDLAGTFSLLVSSVVAAALEIDGDCCLRDAESGRANCEEIIAGSKGAPAIVGCPVGARRAGVVYLFDDGASGCGSRLTPLNLHMVSVYLTHFCLVMGP